MLAGDVGDERTVIALIELSPIGIAQTVEGGGEIGDRSLARRGEMLVCLLVIALLEGLAAEEELGDPMSRLDLDESLGELDGTIPMGRGRLEQEGLFENDLVAGIPGQRLGIEIGCGNRVVVAASHTPREIVAKQGPGVFGRLRNDFRIGRRSRDKGAY